MSARELVATVIGRKAAALIASIAILASSPSIAANAGNASMALDRMPADLETSYALSALPPALRDGATVYLLDPRQGYVLSKKGDSGIECLVQRTAWELADLRDDIYIPLCYDAAGVGGHFKAIIDVASLRVQGRSAEQIKTEIEQRYRDKVYASPPRPGLSYMVSPVMRTVGPPDLQVHTMVMPHFMIYAEGVTNADIGAKPDLANPASLLNPFIDRQGHVQQTYMIQMVGEAEKAGILSTETTLIDALCAYKKALCLSHAAHR